MDSLVFLIFSNNLETHQVIIIYC